MRITVAGFMLVFLTACGHSQTEQLSNTEPQVKQNDASPVVMEKSDTASMSANIESSESNTGSQTSEDLNVEELKTGIVAESTSDSTMIKETGIQTESTQSMDDKSMDAMEGENKEIAKEKESTDKEIVEPKS